MTDTNGSASSGPEMVGQISEPNVVEGFDPASLSAIISRLERSSTLEHLVYREAELDEVWRLLDAALREARRNLAGAETIELLEGLKEMTFKVHDLVGVDSDPQAAAAELRAGLFLARKYSNLRS